MLEMGFCVLSCACCAEKMSANEQYWGELLEQAKDKLSEEGISKSEAEDLLLKVDVKALMDHTTGYGEITENLIFSRACEIVTGIPEFVDSLGQKDSLLNFLGKVLSEEILLEGLHLKSFQVWLYWIVSVVPGEGCKPTDDDNVRHKAMEIITHMGLST